MTGATNVTPISRDEQRLEAASRWVLAIDEGLSGADEAALKAWLAEDPRHQAALLEVAAAWDKADSLSRLAELFPLQSERPQTARPALWSRPGAWAAAASVLAAVAWLFVAGIEPPWTDRALTTLAAHYETAIGEQKTVLLPDGSEVVLNTNSVLRVAYSDEARVLHLMRGELHVEVADDTARPLSVIAGDKIVQAVGTAFTVEITEQNHVEVLVTDGKVIVGVRPAVIQTTALSSEDRPVAIPPVLAQTDANTVDAGEALVLGSGEEVVTPVSADDIEVQLSWKEGRLIFRSEPLIDALAEVERYTTVEFVIMDDDLKGKTLSGRFRAGDVDVLLASLEANLKIAHEYDDEGRVLLSSL